jgi:hypothetical protein
MRYPVIPRIHASFEYTTLKDFSKIKNISGVRWKLSSTLTQKEVQFCILWKTTDNDLKFKQYISSVL